MENDPLKINRAKRFFTEFVIINFLAKNGTTTLTALSKATKLNKNTLENKLNNLLKENVLISEMKIIGSKAIRFLSLHTENVKKWKSEIQELINSIG
jgi:lambda repressor-like predicted transcriptional regulator